MRGAVALRIVQRGKRDASHRLWKEQRAMQDPRSGACRDRTGDLRLAKPALSQLS